MAKMPLKEAHKMVMKALPKAPANRAKVLERLFTGKGAKRKKERPFTMKAAARIAGQILGKPEPRIQVSVSGPAKSGKSRILTVLKDAIQKEFPLGTSVFFVEHTMAKGREPVDWKARAENAEETLKEIERVAVQDSKTLRALRERIEALQTERNISHNFEVVLVHVAPDLYKAICAIRDRTHEFHEKRRLEEFWKEKHGSDCRAAGCAVSPLAGKVPVAPARNFQLGGKGIAKVVR